MAQHYYSSKAVATTLSAAITSTSATTFTAPESATDNGWPTSFPFTLAIDYGTVGIELVDVASKGALAAGIRTWNISRGIDFTTASTHSAGAVVQHVIAARDFTEARQARSLQPLDTETTQIFRETTAGAAFFDSQVGDLIIKVKSGSNILIGVDGTGPPQSYLSFGATNSIFANQQLVAGQGPAAFRRGNGNPFGTNQANVTRTSTQAISANVWTDIAYDTKAGSSQEDDGTMYDLVHPYFYSRVAGLYSALATISWSSLTGTHYLRWITQGGSVTSQSDTAVSINCCAYLGILPGSGYYIKSQTNLTTAMNVVANAASTPSSCTFGQVG